MKHATVATIFAMTALLMLWCGSAFSAEDYHHMHLTATDAKEAAAWYQEHLGGTLTKSGDRVMYGNVAFVWFRKKAGFEGSEGTSVDHIGFSYTDIESKFEGFEAAGVKILNPARSMGALKFGFIEDPWGTKIEIIEDPDLLGFHHVHIHTPDPKATLQWYADSFGGELTTFKGAPFLPSIRYPNMWLIAQRFTEEKAPTKGRAIDHISWSFADLDAAAEDLMAKGVKFSLTPRPFGELKIAFIDAPNGVRIELVQPAAK